MVIVYRQLKERLTNVFPTGDMKLILTNSSAKVECEKKSAERAACRLSGRAACPPPMHHSSAQVASIFEILTFPFSMNLIHLCSPKHFSVLHMTNYEYDLDLDIKGTDVKLCCDICVWLFQ